MYGIDDTQLLWDDQLDKINIAITNKALEYGIEDQHECGEKKGTGVARK